MWSTIPKFLAWRINEIIISFTITGNNNRKLGLIMAGYKCSLAMLDLRCLWQIWSWKLDMELRAEEFTEVKNTGVIDLGREYCSERRKRSEL